MKGDNNFEEILFQVSVRNICIAHSIGDYAQTGSQRVACKYNKMKRKPSEAKGSPAEFIVSKPGFSFR